MSSLKDLASLIMIPSLYKDGELHTVKPLADENIIVHPDATDNNDGVDGTTPSTSGNFTFSRGSNLAATRVDVNGLIEKGRENLLTYSNDFSQWTKAGVTTTSGQTGYDGSSDAWLVTKSGGAFDQLLRNVSSSGVATISLYAKSGTLNLVSFRGQGSTTPQATFNLDDGTISGETGGIIESKATSIGGGWWRLSIVFSQTITNVTIYPNFGGATAGTIYIQDAQTEQGLVATDYIETGTSAAQSGILEDMPRLDYSGGASCPSLLLEPQRSNLIVNSEYFSASGVWLPNTITITDNYGTSPEGLDNSTRLVLGNLTASRIAYAPTLTNGTTYTFSCYYKGTAGEKLYMEGNGSGGSGTQTSKLITLTGEWQREDLQFVGGSSSNLIYIVDSRNGSEDTAQDFEVFGAQLESGSYPTSYIPTYGTSQTRSGDSCLATSVSDVIGQTEGTIYCEFIRTKISDTYVPILTLQGSSIADLIEVYAGFNSSSFAVVIYDNSTTQFNNSFSSIEGANKFAIAYKENDCALYHNGVQIATDTSVAIPTLTQIKLGGFTYSSNYQLGDSIKDFTLFPTRLTNAELAALTTL